MAKRRKLTAPSMDDLTRIEDEFRRETSRAGAMAPIAQVAAQAAEQAPVGDPEERAKQAKTNADADAYTTAQAKGLVIRELPLVAIDAEDMTRDRITIDEAELDELRHSIQANGLRLPIEVYELENPKGRVQYGLISGYRRYLATRALLNQTGDETYQTIRALVRAPESVASAVAAMVEENEVRSALSQFERGRIAVLAAQNGVFTNVEEAVNQLFAAASKAKRSKIRSFALIFEELGDMLSFPEALKEKQGLQLASALRDGSESALRRSLERTNPANAAEEWALLDAAISSFAAPVRNPSRGGRPTGKGGDIIRTRSGVAVRHSIDRQGHALHLSGAPVDDELMAMVLAELQRLLDQ